MGAWGKIAIKSIAKIEYGKSPKGIDTPSGKYPIWGTGGMVGRSNIFLFKAPAIVVGRKGTLGNPIFSESDFWVIDTAYAVLPYNTVLPKYLFYILKDIGLEKYNEATGVPSLSRDLLYKLQIDVPESIVEQTSIVTILNTIDQAIEKTEQLIAKYERIKTGMMQDLLTRGIDEQGNIRSEETHEFKDSVLGRIPKEWEVNKLGNWIRVKGGNAFQSKDFTSSGIQLLRIGNLFNNQFDLHRSPVFLPENYSYKFPEFVLKSGDIIMSMTGTYGKRDYGYAILIGKGEYLLNQRLCKLIFNEDLIDKSFLLFLLRSEYYLDELFKSVTGSKQGNLRNSNILDVKIGLPDIREQRRISEKISLLYEAIQNQGRNLEKLKKQKTALMQHLLTGRVRVDALIKQ